MESDVNPKVILIAEDSEDDTRFLMWALKVSGILNPVRTVKTGDEAIAYLSGSGKYADRELFPFPTVFLLDWIMPGKDGEEVLTWLKDRPERQGMFVAVLTGQDQRKRIVDAYRLGADSFISKPVSPLDLGNLIAHFGSFWILDVSAAPVVSAPKAKMSSTRKPAS